MAFDFPSSPSIGQVFGAYTWDGEKWTLPIASGGGGGTPSSSNPLMDGVAAPGTATAYSRGDHVHPSDTSRLAEAPNDGTQYGRQSLGWSPIVGGSGGGGGNVTGPVGAVADHIATYNGTTGQVIKDGGVTIASLTPPTPAALTRVSDTNVTLTLGGTPATALLQATSITVGWSGTLAPGRGGFGADVSASNGVPLFAAGVPTFTGTTGTGNFARINNPVFTGDPQAPTPTAGDNDTSIATTAFVTTAVAGVSGGTGAVRYDTAQSLTVDQQAQGRANIDALKKNYILNGAMMVSQENGATAGSATGYYPVDQFRVSVITLGTFTVAQVSPSTTIPSAITPGGSLNRLRFTITALDAVVAAGDLTSIVHDIEGLRAIDLKLGTASAKTVTIQFGCKGPAGTYCVSIRNKAGNRSYVTPFTIASGEAGTDVVKSVVIPLDTGNTWVVDTTIGMTVGWALVAGTSFQAASLNTWVSTNALGHSSQSNFMNNPAGTIFELFDVSLTEGGSAAPAFVVPDYASELAACKRYYQKIINPDFITLYGAIASGSTPQTSFAFPVEMRASPANTIVGTWATVNCSQPTVWNGGPKTYSLYTTTSASTPYSCANSNAGSGMTFNARLT